MSYFFRICLSLGAILLTASPCFSASSLSSHKGFMAIEVGAYMTNLKERFEAPAGYASQVSTFKAFIRIHPGFHLGKGWHFEPSFGTMVPSRDGLDGSSSVFISHIDLNLGIPVFSFLKFRIGPGIKWDLLLAKGETVTLGNGTATSPFYIPNRTTNIFLITVQAGLTLQFSHRIGIYLDVYVPEILSRFRRRYHATASIGLTL